MLNQDTFANGETAPVTVAEPAVKQLEPVFRMVSTHAARTPQAPAVVCGDFSLNYRELEHRSNRLAQYFSSCGIGLEHLVALCLPRSPWLVVAALAAHKAGAAYLPLDPTNPHDRLRFMVQDSEAKLLITESALASGLQPDSCPVLCIDESWETVSKFDTRVPDIDVGSDDLAYVIYTSGSTGVPKGVEITHTNLSNLVLWHDRAFGITGVDRASHLAGLGFDASVWETWPYLASGASLYLAPQGTLDSAEQLRDWLVRTQITVSFVPTPIAEGLLRINWPAETKLRLLLTGGDVLRVRPSYGLPFETVNNYGPTECTVVSTSGVVEPNSATCDAPLPHIGAPVDNTHVYVLDESLQPVPEGASGELYIGGANVGRGYRNRPDLTAGSFVENPFDPGTRMYKTGDLGYYRPDGQIAFRGRVDNQIKIRGYRIEPDEIMLALNRHSSIAASVVTACDGAVCSQQQLAAYVVLANGSRPSGTELREFLRKQLPEYMIPSSFIAVDALPLTPNGKLDRKALRPNSGTVLREEFGAAKSKTQERLLEIVSSLLGTRDISTNDNFFLMGGHSLLGAQLIVKVKQAFGVELSLLKLFENGTVAEMAAEIDRLCAQAGQGR